MAGDANFASVSLLLHMDGANNGTIFLDSSRLPLVVTRSGDAKTSTAQSKFGGASMFLDGTGDYLSFPDNAAFGFGTADFTIECWIYITGGQGSDRNIFDFRSSGGNDVGTFFIDGPAGNKLAFWHGSKLGATGASLSTNTWYHVALSRASGTFRCYLNGVLDWSSATSVDFGATRPLGIGAGVFAGGVGAGTFTGYIDDLRISKGLARYTADFTAPTEAFQDRGPRVAGEVRDENGDPTSRTVRAYRRDTGALLGATVPRDQAGDEYRRFVSLMLHADGANNSTTITDSSPTPLMVNVAGNAKISTAQSKFGGSSLLLDGSGDYLNVAYAAALDLLSPVSDFTIECWLFANSLNSAGSRILAIGGGTVGWDSTNGIQVLFQVGSGKLNAQVANNTGSPISVSSTASFTAGAWTHVALCYSPSAAKLYLSINGTVEEFSVDSPARPSTNAVLEIGTIPGEAGSSPLAWNGYMEDIRITKGIARYTANFTPPALAHPDYDASASVNEYVIETGTFTGEVDVICLDDDAGTLENDRILRTFPV